MSRFPRAVALAFLAGSALYLVQATRLPLGSVEQPGAGLFPILVGAFLLAVSAAHLLQDLRRSSGTQPLPPAGTGRRVMGVVAALGAFCLLLPWLGYAVAALGLLLAILQLFGLARWGRELFPRSKPASYERNRKLLWKPPRHAYPWPHDIL